MNSTNTTPQNPEELLILKGRIALVKMYGTEDDRDEALQVFATLIGEYRKVVDERNRVLEELEAVDAVAQEAVDERNAARREVCTQLSLMNPDLSPQEIAHRRGWTCWDGWVDWQDGTSYGDNT